MCPQEVKDRLEELKAIRSSQKSSLKVGYHKIFIDRVWNKLHNTGRGFVWNKEPETTESIGGEDRIGTRMYSASQANEAPALPAVDSLVVADDRFKTSDLIFYTLQQLEPYKPRQQKYGDDDDEEEREIGFPVRETFDLASFFGEHSILPLDFLPHLQGLVCRHCKNKVDGRKFFTTSSEHLGGLLLTIANHVAICRDCPVVVKTQIVSYQFSHDTQLQSKQESHREYMEEAWRRLVALSKQKDKKKPKPSSRKPASRAAARPALGSTSSSYPTVDPNMALVLPEEEQLVTPFTFYTMSQCRPCNLDIKGNGSRSNFDHGFPGLECIHCAGPSSRKL